MAAPLKRDSLSRLGPRGKMHFGCTIPPSETQDWAISNCNVTRMGYELLMFVFVN
jgi:hypothetical protein